MLDGDKPNERTATKQQADSALLSTNAVVMRFTPAEVENNPDGSYEKISLRLTNLIDEMLAEAGLIKG